MNIQKMLKQAQEMQTRLNDMQNKLAEIEMEGVAGGGAVRVVITGKHEARRVTISPELLKPDDKDMLEDLIVAAFNAARGNVENHIQGQMSDVTAGMSLPPGMKLPF